MILIQYNLCVQVPGCAFYIIFNCLLISWTYICPAFIIDLRNTPGGGNSTVARGIMSRLISETKPYQTHELPAEEREFGVKRIWTEQVVPRGPFTYTKPVAVMVGRWTGSMGEGLAIGLDGMSTLHSPI